jgi:hypothetical protein
MGGIFGQALSALQGFFTRVFWFGAFLPVICFAALNLLIAHFVLGWATDLVATAPLTVVAGALCP